ncbi:MAG: hypothetical protein ACREO3_05385 [Arenimonas sp.]
MSLSNPQRLGIGLLLAAAMLLTRMNHFGAIPDASWAVFFLGGAYLRPQSRWAFPLGMVLAVLVDWWVIRASGQSFWAHYCVSVAYWFLVPSYLALWLGGVLLARNYRGLALPSLAWLAGSFVVATSACFVLSNGSFYWLGDAVANATLAGWGKNLGDWYLPYLYTAAMYVGGAAVVHVAVALLAGKAAVAGPAAAR